MVVMVAAESRRGRRRLHRAPPPARWRRSQPMQRQLEARSCGPSTARRGGPARGPHRRARARRVRAASTRSAISLRRPTTAAAASAAPACCSAPARSPASRSCVAARVERVCQHRLGVGGNQSSERVVEPCGRSRLARPARLARPGNRPLGQRRQRGGDGGRSPRSSCPPPLRAGRTASVPPRVMALEFQHHLLRHREEALPVRALARKTVDRRVERTAAVARSPV